MVRIRLVLAGALIGASALSATAWSVASNPAGAAPKRGCPTKALPVVVTVDQWGDIVDQLAGACGKVTTIFKSSSADPHDYEPTPADNARFTGAELVVENGLDYDPWADKAIATLDTTPKVVNGGKVVGLKRGANPHIWSGPGYVHEIADATTAAMKKLRPKAAAYFDAQNAAWRASMKPYDDEISKLEAAASGKTYAATESIYDYMAQALGLVDKTPSGFAKAAANESDPAPGDLNEFQEALADDTIDLLIYNTQTEGSIPEQVRKAATNAKVPVVNVTESVPPQFDSFAAWQISQLKNLANALGL